MSKNLEGIYYYLLNLKTRSFEEQDLLQTIEELFMDVGCMEDLRDY